MEIGDLGNPTDIEPVTPGLQSVSVFDHLQTTIETRICFLCEN